ncbi:hypothetical protein GCM10022286_09990 [Gryllotalpicola daejeonensis]|uniref:Uncharacterized protein n=2 Tax=Gryllotalpicola daejeonensis TaxID=993087 RepID=A0ABP7ZHJ9_9MICO
MPPFARFESSTTQNISAGQDVTLGTAVFDTNANVSNAGAQITLQPGVYYLEGAAGASQTTTGVLTPTGIRMNYAFYNVTAGTYFGAAGGHSGNNNGSSYANPAGPATAVIVVTTPTVVTLRMASMDNAGTINQPADAGTGGQSWVNVTQLQ